MTLEIKQFNGIEIYIFIFFLFGWDVSVHNILCTIQNLTRNLLQVDYNACKLENSKFIHKGRSNHIKSSTMSCAAKCGFNKHNYY